jgi:hypothetical protein
MELIKKIDNYTFESCYLMLAIMDSFEISQYYQIFKYVMIFMAFNEILIKCLGKRVGSYKFTALVIFYGGN